MTRDMLTVLRARNRRLAKLVRADGELVDYDSARTYDAAECPVLHLDELAERLRVLTHRRDRCLVRGGLIDGPQAHGIRRLLHADAATGDAPTLRETARSWLALDVDSVPLPACTDIRDLAHCASVPLALLPKAFHGISHLVQATSSHGIKPGARLRLWFWLDRPINGAEASRWLKDAPVDHSVFRPAQPIYTAAPLFETGRDHLSERLVRVAGAAVVPVPSPGAMAPPRRPTPVRKPRRGILRAGSRYGFAALTGACVRIGSAAESARHYTTVSEAWGLARLVNAGVIAETDMRTVLREGLVRAGKQAEEADAIATWALARRRGAGGVQV